MARAFSLSGFPEWLPAERIVEEAVLRAAQRIFALHGFAAIETRAVEPLERLAGSSDASKEVYGLRRVHGDGNALDLGLHFDLTVPFARYVAENAGLLDFPFRRSQIQKVWRGERPQEGRFREFTQADIDIVDRDRLAFHHDVEMALVMANVLAELPIPRAVIHVSNRKLAEGFYRGLGITDVAATLRTVDKLDKIGPERVQEALVETTGITPAAARACLALAAIRSGDAGFEAAVRALGVSHDLLDEGIAELAEVVEGCNVERPGSVVADLRIARGLDYYTGTVYETELPDIPGIGSIASGGRYDQLARVGSTTYPGVGMSLGVTRLVWVLLNVVGLRATRSVPSVVLIAVLDEGARPRSAAVASALRARGIPCEVASSAEKFGKQIRMADRRGIPFVWFPSTEEGQADSVKDIRSGRQAPADAAHWSPPGADWWPRVVTADDDVEDQTP